MTARQVCGRSGSLSEVQGWAAGRIQCAPKSRLDEDKDGNKEDIEDFAKSYLEESEDSTSDCHSVL
jgi:hypothetical protein